MKKGVVLAMTFIAIMIISIVSVSAAIPENFDRNSGISATLGNKVTIPVGSTANYADAGVDITYKGYESGYAVFSSSKNSDSIKTRAPLERQKIIISSTGEYSVNVHEYDTAGLSIIGLDVLSPSQNGEGIVAHYNLGNFTGEHNIVNRITKLGNLPAGTELVFTIKTQWWGKWYPQVDSTNPKFFQVIKNGTGFLINADDGIKYDDEYNDAIIYVTQTTSPPKSLPIHIKGNQDAPITMNEWVDYSSPFVSRFESTLSSTLNNMPDLVNLQVSQYPFLGDVSQLSAQAVECASLQGEHYFWMMHNFLVENTNDLTSSSIYNYAKKLSEFNYGQFVSCIATGHMKSTIDAYTAQAKSQGISGVPTTVITNTITGASEIISGAQPYDSLVAAIVRVNNSTKKEHTCYDSDGGKNYFVKGTLEGYADFNRDDVKVSDCCIEDGTTGGECLDKSNTLNEVYCKNNKYAVETYKCSEGCLNGACINKTNVTKENTTVYVSGYVIYPYDSSGVYDTSKIGFEASVQSDFFAGLQGKTSAPYRLTVYVDGKIIFTKRYATADSAKSTRITDIPTVTLSKGTHNVKMEVLEDGYTTPQTWQTDFEVGRVRKLGCTAGNSESTCDMFTGSSYTVYNHRLQLIDVTNDGKTVLISVDGMTDFVKRNSKTVNGLKLYVKKGWSGFDKARREAMIVVIASTPSIPKCYDSDSGDNINVAGTIYINGDKAATDYCSSIPGELSQNAVTEFVCNSSAPGYISNNTVNCGEGGCSNGACNPGIIHDTDKPQFYWTEWKNHDAPGGTGDWELIQNFPDVCTNPISIQCETTSGADWTTTGQNVKCDTTSGFSCQNSQNPKGCLDYKVRYKCPVAHSPIVKLTGAVIASTSETAPVNLPKEKKKVYRIHAGESTNIIGGYHLLVLSADANSATIFLVNESTFQPGSGNTQSATQGSSANSNGQQYACAPGCKEYKDSCLCPKILITPTQNGFSLDNNGQKIEAQQIRISPGQANIQAITNNNEKVDINTWQDLKNGLPIPVKVNGKNRNILISSQGANTAISDLNIKAVTKDVVVGSSKGISVETSSGEESVDVLPFDASKKAADLLGSSVRNLELSADSGVPTYTAQVDKPLKLFGLIPVKGTYTAKINAQTGISNTKKPWYSFMSVEQN